MADWKSFSGAVVNELFSRLDEVDFFPDTLYIGGGTPSLMPADILSTLIYDIKRLVRKSDGWSEFTLEINPEDVTEDNCSVWKSAGVTRISMGVQSLNDEELKAIGRRHSASDAINAYKTLERCFDNINVDIMFGLPNQTLETFCITLDCILDLSPQHISAYSLMLEENTPLTVLHKLGKLSLPEEETSLKMWEILTARTNEKGFERYEISNYSKPGFRSIHNSRYWTGYPYLGLGPSAHSYDGNRIRRSNPNDIKGYSHFFSTLSCMNESGSEHFFNTETLDREELIEEMIMLGLRTKEGVGLKQMADRFGEKTQKRVLNNARMDLETGNLIEKDSRLVLSKDGIMVSDDVILRLCMDI